MPELSKWAQPNLLLCWLWLERYVRMKEGQEDVMLVPVKMEEGTTSQRIQSLSREWKMQENGFSLGASRKVYSLANTLILAQ